MIVIEVHCGSLLHSCAPCLVLETMAYNWSMW